jgi:hypothetical protein
MTNSFHCPVCEKVLTHPRLAGKDNYLSIPGYDGKMYRMHLRHFLLYCKSCDISMFFSDAEKRIASYLEYDDGMIYLRDNLH